MKTLIPQHSVVSDLGLSLHCLLRPICLNTSGKYVIKRVPVSVRFLQMKKVVGQQYFFPVLLFTG